MTLFYLGIPDPRWLGEIDVPAFVSMTTIGKRKTLPKATCRWSLDSGAFTELDRHGGWKLTVSEYVDTVARLQEQVGGLDWAAPMDWMCAPKLLQKTGLTVREHQELTVLNYLELRDRGPFIPSVQGWLIDEYHEHLDMYADAGVNLASLPVVGVGTIWSGWNTRVGHPEDLVRSIASRGINIHGFGVKGDGLRKYGYLLTSADSLAWSRTGSLNGSCPGVTRCGGHLHYALEWRERVIAKLDHQQIHLELT